MAESFARRTGTTLLDKPGEELTVLFDAKGVSLIGYGLSYQGDFEGMLHRVSDGRLAHEMLVRAAKTTQTNVMLRELMRLPVWGRMLSCLPPVGMR